MPPASRDAKSMPDWMELDYYARPRPLLRWGRRLTRWFFYGMGVLLVASVVASLTTGRTSTLYQAGPVSPAHAPFNDQCTSCHTQPFRTAQRFFAPSGVHAVADAACQQCHSGAPGRKSTGSLPGPIAYPHNAIVTDEPSCAECHREHRGRLVLARVPDGNCIDCHTDLHAHRPEGDSAFATVTGFPDGHPEFALWRGDHKGLKNGKEDPGRIKFNHKKHLHLEARFLPAGSTKLACTQCHEPDDSGRYMRPINHEKHCQECHKGQRTAQLLGRFADDRDQEAAYEFAREPVPHTRPKEIRDHLNGRLLQFLGSNPVDEGDALDLKEPWPTPWPRSKLERVWKPLRGTLASYHRERFIPPQMRSLEGQLFDRPGGCVFCHEQMPPSGPQGQRAEGVLPQYELPAIPRQWFRHGAFNHQRHLMVDCAHCHEKAENSSFTIDVLIPKKEVCASCHSSAGGARFDCAECHKYHGREKDRAGAHTFLFQGGVKR